jgi:glycine betaine/proline transport system ATP-binding protein
MLASIGDETFVSCAMARKRVIVRDVSKVFGANPAAALDLMRSGESKDSILARTGTVVGLSGASFDVSEGEILVVMGLSGSGKSTMLRCINRLVEPSAGSIVVDGTEVTSLSTKSLLEFRRAKFGMVFQHFALFPNRTIVENVEYGLEIQRIDRRLRTEKAMRAIEVVGLKGWEKKYPSELSGGMQQRAGLARALAVDADILLMDEAFSALDPLIRRGMQQELRQLHQNLRKTIVFVSHDLDEAISLGGRIVLMKDGEIVQIGWPEEILIRPATDYVRRFVEHIDVSSVLTVERLADTAVPILHPWQTISEAREVVDNGNIGTLYVVDDSGRLVGRVAYDTLTASSRPSQVLDQLMQTNVACVQANITLKAALPVLASEPDSVAVVGEGGRFFGSLTSRGAVAALAGIPHGSASSGTMKDGGAVWNGQSQSSRSTNSVTKPLLGSPITAQA